MPIQAKMKQHQPLHDRKRTPIKNSIVLKIDLFKIASQMQQENLPINFIFDALNKASEFEGIIDLFELWSEEDDINEKQQLISDIQDMIDAIDQREISEELYIKFNDLDAIANNIRSFKDSLYHKVIEQGGISKLAELTEIPQPSLSRFFNSNAMPRRSTVLKIAKALNINEIKIDSLWCS